MRDKGEFTLTNAERDLLPGVGDLSGLGQPRFELREYVLLATIAQRRLERVTTGVDEPAVDLAIA